MADNVLRYLAYGSNLFTARLQSRVGPVAAIGTVALPGWDLDFSKRGADGSGKCTLLASPQACAHGVVFEMDGAMRATLDRIEGVGKGYDVDWLDCGEFGRCYVYIAAAAHRDSTLKPWTWYRELVVAGARLHGLPAAYTAMLSTWPALPDPDRERAASNLAVMADGCTPR